jgi:ribose transport system ATP-binding protein
VPMQNGDVIVQISGVDKRYGMAQVLKNVDFDLRKGEVHALVGENGAGKTTLMNVLYGLVNCDKGEVNIKGEVLTNASTSAIKGMGVALIPQKLQMLSDLSVAENLFINIWPKNKNSGLISWRQMRSKARTLLEKVNLDIDPDVEMGSLSYVDQQMVVITRMLFAEKADIIILDEPTAPLVEQEIELLFKFIKSLQAEGYSFIYISHFLHEIFEIGDRATVLRDGEVVFTRDLESLSMRELINGMVGEDVELFPPREHKIGEPFFEVRGLEVPPLIEGMNLSLKRGEILGVAGIKGSGRTEMARAICGLDAKQGGEIFLEGEKIKIGDVGDGLSKGVGYLTEDRIKWGLIGVRPLHENATLTFIQKLTTKLGILKPKEEIQVTEKFIQNYDIRTTGPKQMAQNLSGGNQQKVILAKLLGADLKVLFLDEPTFGIDVKAKTHVYRIMNDFVDRGNAIVMISSDVFEMVEMCDRINILRNGQFVETYDRGEITEKELHEVLSHDSDQ